MTNNFQETPNISHRFLCHHWHHLLWPLCHSTHSQFHYATILRTTRDNNLNQFSHLCNQLTMNEDKNCGVTVYSSLVSTDIHNWETSDSCCFVNYQLTLLQLLVERREVPHSGILLLILVFSINMWTSVSCLLPLTAFYHHSRLAWSDGI